MNSWLSFLYDLFRAIFIFFDAILFTTVIFVLSQCWRFRPDFGESETGTERKIVTLRNALLQERWEAVLKRAASGSSGSLKFAIIEADNFVDDILRRMGLEGEHMADRLEQLSPDDFSTLGELGRAHRVRNQLVHEPDFTISPQEALKTFEDYKAFLQEAGAIE